MRYGSVCSGIEAATMAWHPLGWKPAFFSEIEKFPSAVLAEHYPETPNLGDMTKYKEWPDDAIDLLVGGTPCQSFSIAGLRQGLADPRGNLMLTYLAIARRYQPRWLVWENVPGVLSSGKGRDFGTLIRGLEELGYHAAWRVLDAQFVRVDGYGRAVPQRRRRVFVVGYLGDWRRAAAVLLEPEGMQGDSAPRREKRQGVAAYSPSSIGGYSESRGDAGTLRSHGGDYGGGTETLLNVGINFDGQSLAVRSNDGVASTLDTGAEHHNRGIHIAFDTTQITSRSNYSQPKSGDPCYPLAAGAHPPAVAWSIMPQNSGKDYKAREVDVAQPLMASGPVGGNQGGDYLLQPQAFQSSQSGVRLDDVHATLDSNNGSRRHNGVLSGWAVRRLMPVECERLMGFPDGYTNIPWRGKEASDGPRYKALGNSMAVNCMRWIGRRIEMVERLSEARAA